MDLPGLLSCPQLASLDADVKAYLREALEATADAAEAAELLGPFLAEAEPPATDAETLALCQRFAARKASASGYKAAVSVPAGAMGKLGSSAVAEDAAEKEEEKPTAVSVAPKTKPVRSSAAKRAERLAMEEAALAPNARLELVDADSTAIAKALKVAAPELRGWIEEDAERLEMLGASFLAYAEERLPEKMPKWCQLLQEVLEDAANLAAQLDEDDDLQLMAKKAATQLVKSGLLQAKKKTCEAGDLVLAFLPEDQDWHPAIVEEADGSRLKVIFIEYGKPQEMQMEDVRAMEDVADEGAEEGEGECEMCQRELKLTFHHLIPKDKHPTYLGKRLPVGIEGEPTRYFLNSYGLMICRQCHNTVHNIASNEVLAAQYNTLQKLLAHPVIQRWLEFAKKRKAFSGKSK